MKKTLTYIAGLAVVAALLVTGCAMGGSYGQSRGDNDKGRPVRLLSFTGVPSVSINGLGPCRVINAKNNTQLFALASGVVDVSVEGSYIFVNGQSSGTDDIIVDTEANKLRIADTICRGKVQIVLSKNALDVINELDIEDLICGQVGREMSASSKLEALKAQAVAARTFVTHEISCSKAKGYDLKNLPGGGQIYFGVAPEHQPGNKAVEATRGVTMKFRNEIAFAPYFSNCGGYTEDVREVWGSASAKPYLAPVPCFFCKNGEHYTWSTEIPKSKILSAMNASGRDVGDIFEIDPRFEITKGGRTKTVKLSTDKGKITMSLNDFRSIVGYNVLRSARSLTARPRSGSFYFTGKGWGHGVGMCQDGSNGMAKQGSSYKDILRRYYPGTEISSR